MILHCNDRVYGFSVNDIRPAVEQDGVLYEFTHDRTGVKLAWLSRKEENKTFCIGFATIPDNDCGMFHILEHAVLNGSKRYPVKEPFVELMKSSMQTFLNAMTFPDRTLYPVSSRNEKDFENLVRVYMDAVLHPLVVENPEIFYQEGWHYEPEPSGNGYIRNGVVLNEMKGAYSSGDAILQREMKRLLYPDTCYRYEAGGFPEDIPRLSYEQLVEYHRKYYRPSNAYIFLDGELPVERILSILDMEYLKQYNREPVEPEISIQKKTAPAEAVVPYPSIPGLPEEKAAQMGFGYVAGTFDEKEKLCAAAMLAEYLAGDQDAPLKKAILEQELAQDVEVFLYDGIKQPFLLFLMRNTDKNRRDEISKVLRETLQGIVRCRIDKDRMKAVLNRMEFQAREQEFGWVPEGVGLALKLMGDWMYGLDIMEDLKSESVFTFLRGSLENGYFENIIEEMILSSENQAFVCLTPSEDIMGERLWREKKEINGMTKGWSEQEKGEEAHKLRKLKQRQTTPDKPDKLALIPSLKLSDVESEPEYLPMKQFQEKEMTLWTHELPTRGIVYVTLYFPLPLLEKEELSKVSFLCGLLGELRTAGMSSEQLKLNTKTDLGRLNFSMQYYQDQECRERCKAYFQVDFSVLKEKLGKIPEYAAEILLGTQFDEKERVREILIQAIEGMRQNILGAGHHAAMRRAGAHISASGAAAEYSGGMTCYQWMREISGNYEKEYEHLVEDWRLLCRRIFTCNGLIISMTGGDDSEFARRLWNVFPKGEKKPAYAVYEPESLDREGIEIPSEVAYAVCSAGMTEDTVYGRMKVLARYLTLNYLWNRIRVQGGAYGTGLQVSDSGMVSFYSYRDPDAAGSLRVYREAPEVMRKIPGGQQNITGVILGTLAEDAPLRSSREQGAFADRQQMLGVSYEQRCRRRNEILSMTPEKLAGMAESLEDMLNHENICVVGGAMQIEKCGITQIEKL